MTFRYHSLFNHKNEYYRKYLKNLPEKTGKFKKIGKHFFNKNQVREK